MKKTYRVLTSLALTLMLNSTALYSISSTVQAAEMNQNMTKSYSVSTSQESSSNESMAQKYLNSIATVTEKNGFFHVTVGISDIETVKNTNLKFYLYDNDHNKSLVNYTESTDIMSISFDVPSISDAILMNVTYDVPEYNIHGNHNFKLLLTPISHDSSSAMDSSSEFFSQSSSEDIVKNESIESSESDQIKSSSDEMIVNSTGQSTVFSQDSSVSTTSETSLLESSTQISSESPVSASPVSASPVSANPVSEIPTVSQENSSSDSENMALSNGNYEIPFSFWKENEDVPSSAQNFFKKAWLKFDGSTMKVALLAKNQFSLSLGNLENDKQIPGLRLMENDSEFITEINIDSLDKPQLFYVSYQVGNRSMAHALRLMLSPEKAIKTNNYPEKNSQMKDGMYSVPFDVLKEDEDVSSGSKQFFKSAFVKVENGEKYIALVATNKFNLNLGTVENEHLTPGTRIYENQNEFATQMRVNSLDKPVLVYVNYQAGPMNMTHRVRISLDISKLEPTLSYPKKVEEPSTTEPSTTEPSTTEPSTTEPSMTEPSTTEPSTTEPSTTEPSTTESKIQTVGIQALQKNSNELSIAQQYLASRANVSAVKDGYNVTIALNNLKVAREASLKFFLYDQSGNKIPLTYNENTATKMTFTFFVSSLDKEVLMNVTYILDALNIQGDHDFRLVFANDLSSNQEENTIGSDVENEQTKHTNTSQDNIPVVNNIKNPLLDGSVQSESETILGLDTLDRPAEMQQTANRNENTASNSTYAELNPHTDASKSPVLVYIFLAVGSFSYIVFEIYRKKSVK
ncbi:NEAT domain-containing protein [Enterococcus bulliens]